MKPILALLALLALCVGITLYFVGSTRHSHALRVAHAATAAAVDADPRRVLHEQQYVLALAAEEELGEAQRTTSSAPIREVEPPADGREVEVIHADGSAAAGAFVFIPDDRNWDRQRADSPKTATARGLIDALAGAADAYRTDADGRTRVPTSDLRMIIASSGDAIGWPTSWEGDDKPIRIELVPERVVHVVVLHTDGSPARNVTVSTAFTSRDGRGMGRSTRTDSDGRATLGMLDLAIEQFSPADDPLVATAVVASLPYQDDVSAALPEGDGETVTLELPPVGRLRVELLSHTGGPASDKAMVSWKPVTRATEERIRGAAVNGVLNWGPVVGHGQTVTTSSGYAELDLVPLNTRLAVTARRFVQSAAAAARATESTEVQTVVERPVGLFINGPARRGEVASAQLTIDARPPSITGRIANARAEPSSAATSPARDPRSWKAIFRTREWSRSKRLDLAANGSFVIPLDQYLLGEPTLDLLLREEAPGESGMAPSREVLLEGLTMPQSSLLDLGDLLLQPAALVAAGVVLSNGKPVEGCQVTLEKERLVDRGPRHAYARRVTRGDERATVTDENGRFVLRGGITPIEHPERYVLKVLAPAYLPVAPLPFEPGAAELRIELESAGWIKGRVDSSGTAMKQRFEVTASRAGEAVNDARRHAVRGDFHIPSLTPGTYELSFFHSGRESPVATVPGVRVIAGEETRDPRLEPLLIELSEAVVVVTDQTGSEIHTVSFRTRASAEEPWSQQPATVEWSGEGWEVPLPGLSCDLRVEAPGYTAKVLVDVDGPRSVVLEPARGLTLALTQEVRARLNELHTVHVSLEHEDDPSMTLDADLSGADDSVIVLVQMEGTYEVSVAISGGAPKRDSGIRYIVSDVVPATVKLMQGEFENPLTLELPDARLQAALDALDDQDG